MRKHNPAAEFGPPGFPAQDKAAAPANPWHQGSKRNSEDQRILYLEEKILNWLAMKDKVTTTEMAEFAYATHEELVPGVVMGPYWSKRSILCSISPIVRVTRSTQQAFAALAWQHRRMIMSILPLNS